MTNNRCMRWLVPRLAGIVIAFMVFEIGLRGLASLYRANPNASSLTLVSALEAAKEIQASSGKSGWYVVAEALMITLVSHAAVASACATICGIIMGLIVSGICEWMRASLLVSVDFMRSVPATLLIPLVSIALPGDSDVMVVLLSALPSAAIMSFGVIRGVDGVSVDRLGIYAVNNGRVGGVRQFWTYTLPAALPDCITGFRIVVNYSVVLSVVIEMFGKGSMRSVGRLISAQLDAGGDISGLPLLLICATCVSTYCVGECLLGFERYWDRRRY